MSEKNVKNPGEAAPVLEKTFLRLKSLYEGQGIEPGAVATIGLKPGWVVVVGTNKECGTAFRFSGPHKIYEGQEVEAAALKRFVGCSLMEVARENLNSPLIPLRCIAVAALSALSQRFIREDSLAVRGIKVMDDRSILEKAVRADDVVTIIGYGGMVEQLLGKCRELHVADMRSRESLFTTLIGERIEYVPRLLTLHGSEEDETLLSKSDVVLVTASSLVNGTVDDLLRFAAPARMIGLYGPSASIIPDALFESGVNFVMSHCVLDPDKFIYSMVNDMNMEQAIRKLQRYQTLLPGNGDLMSDPRPIKGGRSCNCKGK